MQRATLFAALALTGLLSPDVSAAPSRVCAEGDSISVAFNADDQCNDLLECIGNLGADSAYSWTTGSQEWSLRNRMGGATTCNQQKNGSRWDDAPGQTDAFFSAGGGHTLTIMLGGNDLMISRGATLRTKEEFRVHVRSAFDKIVYGSAGARPANVIVVGIPDVVRLRDLMRNQRNFAFETCQGVWDDFKGPISSSLEVCEPKWWNPLSWLCGIANLLQKWTNWVNGLKDVIVAGWGLIAGEPRFPGGYILHSSSPDSNRTLARTRQAEYNAALQEEVGRYNGINGVRFTYSGGVSSFAFDTSQVSKLDCFHPNRLGQRKVAEIVWNDVNQSIFAMGVYGGTTGAGSDVGSPNDTTAPTVAGGSWTGSWASPYELRQNLSTAPGSSSDLSGAHAKLSVYFQNYGYDGGLGCYYAPGCYVGYLREQSVTHSFGIRFSWDAYYWDYYRVWVVPSDQKGNAASYTGSPGWF